MTNRKIVWEKWYDIINETDENEEDLIYEEDEEDEDLIKEKGLGFFFETQNNKIRTPIGSFYIDEPLNPSNMYDCWIGHTNFKLTDDDYLLLDDYVDGLEVIKIMSKYRFFIGVAKQFKFKDVQEKIKQVLEFDEDSLRLNMTQDKIWSAFVGDDGKIEHIVKTEDMTTDEYEKRVEELKSLKNGCFITSIQV